MSRVYEQEQMESAMNGTSTYVRVLASVEHYFVWNQVVLYILYRLLHILNVDFILNITHTKC